jgi:hypothetical protein
MAPAADGLILAFRCVTRSAFHTSRQEYANLIKCAPFILGTTLRGAVLGDLVRTHCSPGALAQLEGLAEPAAIAAVHTACPDDCPARYFYQAPPAVCFSFGVFDEQPALARTRIALERQHASVAEGALFSVEAVAPGTPFTFEIVLRGAALRHRGAIEAAVGRVGEWWGIGRLRSIGFGLFDVSGLTATSEAERLAAVPVKSSVGPLTLEFETPYILGTGDGPADVSAAALKERLSAEFSALAGGPLTLAQADARLELDFVGRFSYERGLRENYLVAWPGSQVALTADRSQPGWTAAMAQGILGGIGVLREVGFGRFRLT